ncbi:hypothetical protein I79_006952 [Cricetulus griseus]|uniref:Uncharacterized protein n=1 Tax=Cricetulus griseus TaxID=10029 RepID=G3H986_CRIGR|nr:hypothetical protein I79_006952 [Cricetulus griseus]
MVEVFQTNFKCESLDEQLAPLRTGKRHSYLSIHKDGKEVISPTDIERQRLLSKALSCMLDNYLSYFI